MISKTLSQQGFSLVQVSILVAVAGVILASLLPAGELGSDVEKNRITKEKMEKIEAATQSFMAANLRRPCPADGTLAIGSANFGKEDTTAGRCSSSNFWTQSVPVTRNGTYTSTSAIVTGLANTTGLSIGMLVTDTNIAADTHIASVDSATQITLDKYPIGNSGPNPQTFTSVAAGVVPTKTLGLPDDFMFDGYGRRIGYMVDIRATDKTTCRNIQTTKTSGAIQIMDSAAATNTTDNVMWSMISYGKNGHGAFSMQGSSVASRINSGATNDDEEINAFINTAGTFATAFTKKLVKHEPITTSGATYFDDTVWTQESTKNTCCTGKLCMVGTRIDGDSSGDENLGSNVAIGDINGDGVSDMVFYKLGKSIRVIFGSITGWSPSAGMAMGTANSSRFITITNNSSHSNFAGSVAVGNIDGDAAGTDEIAIGYGDGTNSYIKVFYWSKTPASTNTSAITDVITFPPTTASSAPSIVLGNFANTTKKDILALITTASGAGNSTAYVIYGAASYALTAEAVTTVAASVGFKINTSTGILEAVSGTGDLNNDTYDELLISNYTDNNLYVMFGRTAATWGTDISGTPCLNNGTAVSCGTAATGSTPDIINIDTEYGVGTSAGATPTKAVKFTNGGSGEKTMAVADINGDGTYKDLIFDKGDYYHIYYGKASGSWTAPINLSTAANYNGTNGFRIDTITNAPSWFIDPMTKAAVADVNNDGKIDMIFSDNQSEPNSKTQSGTSFVALQPSGGWSSIWTSGTVTLFSQIFATGSSGLPLNNDVSKGFRIDGYAINDEGSFKNIADINNDGKNDLIMGAPIRSTDVGSVYILFGRTIVPWDTSTNLQILN